MNRLFAFALLTILFLGSKPLQAQFEDTTKNLRVYPLPILSYSPETRGTFGALALAAFRFKGEKPSSRNSLIEIGGAYTQEDQYFIYMPFDVYAKDEKWYFKGVSGFYGFSYFFWGIGNEAENDNEELYELDFLRFRMDALRLIKPKWYVGLRYWMENYDMVSVKEDGLFESTAIPGSDGGLVSSAGLVTLFDSRDNYNWPSKGNLLEAMIVHNSDIFGSDFEFNRFSFDYINYTSIGKSVIANNIYLVGMNGEPPFNELALIGGRNKMRGYYLGRYRNKNMVVVQSEWRRKIWWRLGMTAFAAFGNVSPTIEAFAFENTLPSAGVGFRFMLDEKEKINLRVDYAVGQDGSDGLYVAFKEAF